MKFGVSIGWVVGKGVGSKIVRCFGGRSGSDVSDGVERKVYDGIDI